MSKDFGNWWYDEKNGVVKKHTKYSPKDVEIYYGDYKKAQEWFVGDSYIPDGDGKLVNIIITHQFGDRFNTKTTAEMFEILMKAAGTRKYYIQPEKREDEVLKQIADMKRLNLNFDKEIISNLQNKETLKSYEQKKIWQLEKFNEKYAEKLNIEE